MSFDQDKVSKNEQPMPGDYFPEATPFNAKWVKRLGGFDIYKSGKLWMALVATEDTTKINNTRVIRWYRWEMKPKGWTNAHCTMKVNHRDFEDIKRKIEILKKIYKIN